MRWNNNNDNDNDNRSERLWKKEKGVNLTLKTAGSFMSFHMPSTPLDIKSLTKLAHQERAFSWVKSGKTQAPGHTSPVMKMGNETYENRFENSWRLDTIHIS